MSGSYIDPCESGAYQGSGSVGSEGSGSWNGSGSGNDSITSENCCPQPAAGVACCIPGSLKMRLYQIVPSSYEDPDLPGVVYITGNIIASRIYTLTKTVFCADTNSKTEQWVITDPDSTFGDWGDLTGAYFTSGDHGNKAFYTGYSLVLPNSPVIRISDLLVQCRCQICTHCTQEDGSKANVLPECKGCFLARGVEPLVVGDQGTIWGSAFSNHSLPSLARMYRHNVMIWGESTDLEACFGISDTPPQVLQTQQQIATPSGDPCVGGTKPYSSSGAPLYWNRVAFAFANRIGTEGPTMYYPYVGKTFPPYYLYADCRYPVLKGANGSPDNLVERSRIRASYLVCGVRHDTHYNIGHRWISGRSFVCSTLGLPTDYHSANAWYYNRKIATTWFGDTEDFQQTYPTTTIKCDGNNVDSRLFVSNSVNGLCIPVPKSITPVYEVLYAIPAYRPLCVPVPDLYNTPCEERVGRAGTVNRLIITEAAACVIVPPAPPPLPPPASGSTPSPIGSEPGSGSSGSGSGGSSEPIVCAGNCEYKIYYRELNQNLTWTLLYRLWNNDCRLSCRCDGEQEITVTYVGEPYQWPNELFFPCVATTSGSTPGSTSEE